MVAQRVDRESNEDDYLALENDICHQMHFNVLSHLLHVSTQQIACVHIGSTIFQKKWEPPPTQEKTQEVKRVSVKYFSDVKKPLPTFDDDILTLGNVATTSRVEASSQGTIATSTLRHCQGVLDHKMPTTDR